MFEVLGLITGFFKTLFSLWSYLGAGAAAALFGHIVGRYINPLWGLAVGAAIVGGMYFWVWSADNLRAQNEALRLKQNELRLTQEALRNTLKEMADAALNNEKVVNNLKIKLEAMPDLPECVIPEDITDELNKIE